jgi:O6-methylguanine-DNA--protein-cysteine methyltransferase
MTEADHNAALEAIVTLTEKLTGLLAEQARAFEQHRPQDAARTLDEISRLTNVYRTASAHVRGQPQMVEAAPDDLRRRLLRALAATKTGTEGLVKAIAEEIALKRGVGQAYGPNAARRIPATAITLNRQA